jgi:uncharacterized membrane protein
MKPAAPVRSQAVSGLSGRAEAGQAMTEYVVALAGAVVGLIVFSRLMQIAVFRYLQPIYFWVGLPIP